MSTSTTTKRISPRSAVQVGLVAASVAAILNLLALAIGHAVGADMYVDQGGAADPMQVGVPIVVIATVVPIALGAAVLALTSRWGALPWTVLAWVGLVVGVASAAMPFTAGGSTATAVVLASMHVFVGAAWFVAIARTVRNATL